MNRIETIGDVMDKTGLLKLGTDPDLEGFMNVCYWKDGTVTCGWTPMKHSEMAFGLLILDEQVRDDIKQYQEGGYD